MPKLEVQALLFDLGGVLIDISFERMLRVWQPYSSLDFETLKQRFSFDEAFQAHERGELETKPFLAHLAAKLHLDADFEILTQGWNAILGEEITQTRHMVERLRGHLPCYLFSNTNALHKSIWEHRFPELVAAFEQIFVSHEMGMRKPNADAFNYICQKTGIPAEKFVFFDDTLENVIAAKNCGFYSIHYRSPQDVAELLDQLDLEI